MPGVDVPSVMVRPRCRPSLRDSLQQHLLSLVQLVRLEVHPAQVVHGVGAVRVLLEDPREVLDGALLLVELSEAARDLRERGEVRGALLLRLPVLAEGQRVQLLVVVQVAPARGWPAATPGSAVFASVRIFTADSYALRVMASWACDVRLLQRTPAACAACAGRREAAPRR